MPNAGEHTTSITVHHFARRTIGSQQPTTCYSMGALPIPERKGEEGVLQQGQNHHYAPRHHQMHR